MRSLCTYKRPCPKCKRVRSKNGHDPCIADLPGVVNACCGHGAGEGYVMFENGITLRGSFEIEYPDAGTKRYLKELKQLRRY